MLNLKIKRLTPTATLPTKAHNTDACFDIYADINEEEWCCCIKKINNVLLIPPHTTIKVHTGFATNIPHGYWGAVFARSGLATKTGLRPANCVGVIDESYTGEWMIALHNDTDKPQSIRHGDRIAQFTLLPYFDTELEEVDELDQTDRGAGGFGSSGV